MESYSTTIAKRAGRLVATEACFMQRKMASLLLLATAGLAIGLALGQGLPTQTKADEGGTCDDRERDRRKAVDNLRNEAKPDGSDSRSLVRQLSDSLDRLRVARDSNDDAELARAWIDAKRAYSALGYSRPFVQGLGEDSGRTLFALYRYAQTTLRETAAELPSEEPAATFAERESALSRCAALRTLVLFLADDFPTAARSMLGEVEGLERVVVFGRSDKRADGSR